MGNFVNRTTLRTVRSGNEPDYIDPPWLAVPPGSNNEALIDTVERRYLKIAGDVLSEMSQAEKDAVDAAEVVANNDAAATEAIENIDQRDSLGATTRQLIENLTKTHNKLANRIREVERALNDVKNTSGGSDNIRGAIPLPSAEVISEGSAPATFTNLQNRSKAQEVSDFKADLAAGDQDV